jgi:hypothetical protein
VAPASDQGVVERISAVALSIDGCLSAESVGVNRGRWLGTGRRVPLERSTFATV